MPQVQIVMLQGRTEEQKRRVARRVTEVLEEEAGARREAISISFIEVPAESYASAGVLVSDKRKPGS
jgi:4-oxalocrotonate tautomerase